MEEGSPGSATARKTLKQMLFREVALSQTFVKAKRKVVRNSMSSVEIGSRIVLYNNTQAKDSR